MLSKNVKIFKLMLTVVTISKLLFIDFSIRLKIFPTIIILLIGEA